MLVSLNKNSLYMPVFIFFLFDSLLMRNIFLLQIPLVIIFPLNTFFFFWFFARKARLKVTCSPWINENLKIVSSKLLERSLPKNCYNIPFPINWEQITYYFHFRGKTPSCSKSIFFNNKFWLRFNLQEWKEST